jgi:gas vesicle protein
MAMITDTTDGVATDTSVRNTPHSGFTLGLITGGLIGAALGLAFAPRAGADLRRDVADAARDLGTAASEGYQTASSRVAKMVGPFAHNVHAVREEVAEGVASGAREVEQFARAVERG